MDSKARKSRAAKPKPTEGLDLDRMWNSPSMKGMLSFLDISPAERSSALEERAVLPEKALPGIAGAVTEGAVLDGPVTGAPTTGAPETVSNEDYTVPRTPPRPRPWTTVADAHTLGEQALYSSLLRLARDCGPGQKKVVIGLTRLAPLVPLSVSNCALFLKTLEAKLAIRQEGIAPKNQGRILVVYAEPEVLRRRREASLTHVVRQGRAVTLVAMTGIPVRGD